MKTLLLSAAIAACSALSALAADLMTKDAYAFATASTARAGAAYLTVMNHGDADRLLGASSDAAARVELHAHNDVNGVMQMREIEGGVEIPMHGSVTLMPGDRHIMLMGLTAPLTAGDSIEVTLRFEKAGDITVTVPVVDRGTHTGTHGQHGTQTPTHKHGS